MSDELAELRKRLIDEWADDESATETLKPVTDSTGQRQSLSTPPFSQPVEVTSALENQTVKLSGFQQGEGTVDPRVPRTSSGLSISLSFFVRTRIIGTLLFRKLRTSEIHF